jgi:hypothetical protein
VDHHAQDNATEDHRVTLVKGDQRWVFRCARGEESDLLRRVSVLAAGDAADLDWTDAALIARRLGRRLTTELSNFVTPSEADSKRDGRST